MNNLIPFNGKIHLTNIGGIGMSAIAEMLNHFGAEVQGTEAFPNKNTERLNNKNIEIFNTSDKNNMNNVKLLIISSATPNDNPELIYAKENNIKIYHRSEVLAKIMQLNSSIAITGTHGKTTTTSITGIMLDKAGLDPNIINGGIINKYESNCKTGEGDWTVVEADESDGSFLNLPKKIAVVTNIEPEHMENYRDFDDMKEKYIEFIETIDKDGFAVLCKECGVIKDILPKIKNTEIITYGLEKDVDVRAINIQEKPEGSYFDIITSNKLNNIEIKNIFIKLNGKHNILNSLSSFAISLKLKLDIHKIKTSLNDFDGVQRRFTQTGIVKGVKIIDDYGHHPSEIKAVLNSASKIINQDTNNIIAIFQPHKFSRVKSLFNEFSVCFNKANSVIVADIYPAGEQPVEGLDKNTITDAILKSGHNDVCPLNDESELARIVSKKVKSGDMIICFGAGTITTWAHNLPEELESLL
jgi:UDP-N-acetylmuramate--alanine ligase